MSKDLDMVTTVPPCYSLEPPKPLYENDMGKAFWDILAFAENVEVRNNRINKEKKNVYLLEINCTCIASREEKSQGKLNTHRCKTVKRTVLVRIYYSFDELTAYRKELQDFRTFLSGP